MYKSLILSIIITVLVQIRGCHGRDRMVVGFQLPVQSVPITTKIVSSNPVNDEVYSIQHYVIKFISDLQEVSGFSLDTPVSSTNKTDHTI